MTRRPESHSRPFASAAAVGGVRRSILRAGIVIGHRGVSWEITRQLVEHLPAMVTPRWVRTPYATVAVADVVRYQVGVLDVVDAADRTYEIGGPEVSSSLHGSTGAVASGPSSPPRGDGDRLAAPGSS